MSRTLLRQRHGEGHASVTNIELFFDLVFVFAVTQLSHTLLGDLTALGALRVAMLFLAVWWAWIYTSWVTNSLDPDRWAVRVALIVLMLAGLVLSTSLPKAFGDKGVAFAGAYVAIQVGRSLFMLWAIGNATPRNTRNYQRITIWLAVTGLLWLAGGFAAGTARLALWLVAIGLETAAPALGFRVPGLGRSTTDDWDVEGSHLAERCSLFIIIALGETLLVTGATVSDLKPTLLQVAAFAIAFVGSAAQWWIYFDTGAERGSQHIAEADDTAKYARLLYTYIHLLIVAGIIVSAVGDELLLAHPERHPDAAQLAATLGGAALFLAGNTLFKGVPLGFAPLSHLVGLALLALAAAVAPIGPGLNLAGVNALCTSILCLVAAAEAWSLHRRHTPTHG